MVFGLGLFVIVAAIMRAVYCTVPALVSYIYMNWYFREASVAVYVTMLPAIWSLLRDVFPGLQSSLSGGRSGREGTSQRKQQTSPPSGRWRGSSKLQSGLGSVEDFAKSRKPGLNAQVTDIELNRHDDDDVSADDCSTTSIHANAAEIRRDVTVTVEYGKDENTWPHRPAFH